MKRPNLRLITPMTAGNGSTLIPFGDQALRDVLMSALRSLGPGASGRVVLRVESLPKDAEDALVSVDAVFNGPLRVPGPLTVRVRRPPLTPAKAARVAAAALEQFGDVRFTSLSAWRPGERGNGDNFDVTVSFPHQLPFVSRNWMVVPPLLSAEEAKLYSHLLHTLGISHRRLGTDFRYAAVQLRRRLSKTAPVAALRAALEGELDAALYTAALPVTQSMRFEQVALPGRAGHLECVLSRGLSGNYTCSSEDADEMQSFLERQLEVSFVDRLWRATSSTLGAAPRAAQQSGSPARRVSHPQPATTAPPARTGQQRPTRVGGGRSGTNSGRGAKVIPLSRARRQRQRGG